MLAPTRPNRSYDELQPRISVRLRPFERDMLGGLVEKAREKYPALKDMSRHQMYHYFIQYCNARQETFLPLVAAMVETGTANLDEWQKKYGRVYQWETEEMIRLINRKEMLT